MKKVLLATLVAAMLLCSFVGCNNNKNGDDTTTPVATTPSNDNTTTTPDQGGSTTVPSTPTQAPDPYGIGAFVSFDSDDLYDYEIYENGAVISAYKGDETTITLPATVGETKVYAIAQNAFANSAVVSVTIPDGYTIIGEGAFMSSTALTSVTIPASVKEIREDAFKFCSSVKSVALPATVETLGAKIFYGCTALESVNLPTAIKAVPNSMFFGCSSLKNITIPATVETIEANAFYYCTSLEEATLPAGVTSVGNSAFYNCVALKEAVLPEGLTTIGTSAYFACASIKSITIPASVTTIGNGAFGSCSSVESVTLPAPVYEGEGEEKTLTNALNMGTAVFARCTSLKSFDIPATIKDVPAGMFNGCTALETVTINNKPAKIGDYAFANTALKSFDVPASVTAIGSRSFQGCSSLESIVLPEGIKNIGTYAFSNCTSLTSLNVPASVSQILEGLCSGCSSLSSVMFNDGTQKIATLAFYECPSLKSVKLPGSISDIKQYAFGCGKGEAEFTVLLPDGTTEIQVLKTDYAYDKNFEIYGFTNTVSSDYCKENGVKFFAIGNAGENAFEDFSYKIDTIEVPGKGTDAEGNEIDVMVPQEVVTFIKYVGTKKEVVIPTNINGAIAYRIDKDCFKDTNVTSVVIPNGVVSIGENAFKGCTELAQLTVPAGVETYGSYAFAGTAITEFTIDAATVIPDGMFAGCTKLASFVLNPADPTKTITEIGDKAFENCSITSFTIPETVTSIGSDAFLGCLKLSAVDVPDSVKSIGKYAFGFTKVNGQYAPISEQTYEVVIEQDKVDADGNPVLDDEGNPVKETITNTVNCTFSMGYFNGAVSDTYVKTNNLSGTALGNTGETPFSHFEFAPIVDANNNTVAYSIKKLNTADLTEVVVPSSYMGLPVTKIDENAFSSKTTILKVVVPESVTVIAQYAFKGCSKLTECYVLGSEVTFEGTYSPWNQLSNKLTVYVTTATANNLTAFANQRYVVADINAQPEA